MKSGSDLIELIKLANYKHVFPIKRPKFYLTEKTGRGNAGKWWREGIQTSKKDSQNLKLVARSEGQEFSEIWQSKLLICPPILLTILMR